GLTKHKSPFNYLTLFNACLQSHSRKRWNMNSEIILTPEIVEKCGFKTNPTDFIFRLKSISLVYSGPDKGFIRVGINKPCYVQFLHQLQNLYFIETGEELNIQL
ncbi:MAG: hypothetical protein ABI405_12430, partial [Parafilimonas sp.]